MKNQYKTIKRQSGLSLVELMIGIAVGMLVVSAAIGSVMFVRASSKTVSESAKMEQEANFVSQIISRQIRQSGALNIQSADGNAEKVKFNTSHFVGLGGGNLSSANQLFYLQGEDITTGAEAGSSTITFSYSRPADSEIVDSDIVGNCIGTDAVHIEGDANNQNIQIYNHLRVRGSMADAEGAQLQCGINVRYYPLADPTAPIFFTAAPAVGAVQAAKMETILRGVKEFNVRYLNQQTVGGNQVTVSRTAAQVAAAGGWSPANPISAIEICIHLVGETAQVPETTITKCDGTQETYTDQRIHKVFRNMYELRNSL